MFMICRGLGNHRNTPLFAKGSFRKSNYFNPQSRRFFASNTMLAKEITKTPAGKRSVFPKRYLTLQCIDFVSKTTNFKNRALLNMLVLPYAAKLYAISRLFLFC